MSALEMPPKQRVQFNFALTHFTRLDQPRVVKQRNPLDGKIYDNLVLENEQELDQWYFEFKKFPLPEDVVEKALAQVIEQIKHEMRSKGFMYAR